MTADEQLLFLDFLDLYRKGIRYRHRYAAADFERVKLGKDPHHIKIKTDDEKELISAIRRSGNG